MATEQWILLGLVVVGLGVIVSLRFFKASHDRLRSEHPGLAPPAPTLAAQAGQREDRRLAGMSAEDRAWEQAALQRNRDHEARSQAASNAP